MIPIFALTQEQYAEAVQKALCKGRIYAKRIYRAWMKEGKVEGIEPWIEPQAKALVAEILSITQPYPIVISHVQEEGSVRKFLLRYKDGLESESVIIPMKFGYTLCVSSQIGCKMGCAFCQTGKMGLIRSLHAEEIVAQLFAAKYILQVPIRNIVFMGMGEPFDNYEAVMQAINVMTEQTGFALGHSKITVSTSGKVEEIRRFANQAHPALRLAVSLNAQNNFTRSRLMPVNNTWNLEALKEAMLSYCSTGNRRILIEYVLLEGKNDSLEAAEEVANYLEGVPVTINLIPYNTQKRGVFAPPQEEVVLQFRKHLQQRGYDTLLRLTKGRSIMAACGQLSTEINNKYLRKETESRIVPII
jgi:23S rRNA (adenine2503-C2)-methyltransferase